jgi:exodeoxyribonuclease VII large subunit
MQIESEISILTVASLNTMVHDLLEECFAEIWVEGEISNLIQAASGHYYFTLKDKEAQVKCAFFKGATRNMTFRLENGQHVLVRAKVSLYTPRGDYQLIVNRVEEMGDGALQRAFEKLKKQLDSEGLFNAAYKKALPKFPQRIGVVTSATGAAIRDILQVLNRRFPLIEINIYPTLVQGKEAAAQIAHAIALANQHAKCDVLIVGRGGGSLEDLWSFNEEIVARAIFASEIPVISAVGHEIDFTIADFVADIRAPTPSAAAELVSPDGDQLATYFFDMEIALINSMQSRLARSEDKLFHLTKRLQHPKSRLLRTMQRVDELSLRLRDLLKFILARKHQALQLRMGQLNALSPLATLDRGYAIVKNKANEKVVHFARDVETGNKVEIRFADGVVDAVIAN